MSASVLYMYKYLIQPNKKISNKKISNKKISNNERNKTTNIKEDKFYSNNLCEFNPYMLDENTIFVL